MERLKVFNKERVKSLLSKTVYSLRFPETREFIANEMSVNYKDLYLPNHDAPYLQTQPELAQRFADEYRRFLRVAGYDNWPIMPDHEFSATAGSSEAIRQVITETVVNGGRVFCRPGEYEGYRAYTESVNGAYVESPVWASNEKVDELNLTEKDLFIISLPSAIDGRCMDLDYSFIKGRGAKVAIDLAYVGILPSLFGNTPLINGADYVFVSLSKVFGLYYHRIGGVFCKPGLTPKGLIGQKWFMNIDSLQLGVRLMQEFSNKDRYAPSCSDHHLLFRKYVDAGNIAVNIIEKTLGVSVSLSESDKKPKSINLLFGLFDGPVEGVMESPRISGAKDYRVCISPLVDHVLNKGLKGLY